jgi:FixJ family two-component response regulator
VDEEVLISAVERALAAQASIAATNDQVIQIRKKLERLTPRELDVLREVITGAQNKQIGDRLGIALKTVKIHRSRVMTKMEAESVIQLAQMASLVGID